MANRSPLTSSTPASAGADDQEELRTQKELALACAWLSLFISLAVLVSNFGREPAAIGEAQAAVEIHQKLLAAAREDLAANEKELENTRATLVRMKAAGSKTP